MVKYLSVGAAVFQCSTGAQTHLNPPLSMSYQCPSVKLCQKLCERSLCIPPVLFALFHARTAGCGFKAC
eukprot:1161671-Pelagomonas_calceolata.AAC.25